MSDIEGLIGKYENHLYDDGGKNDWHWVAISKVNDTTLQWSNRAGVQWTLTTTADPDELAVGADCPYYAQGYTTAAVARDGYANVMQIVGPGGEPYVKSWSYIPRIVGSYENHLYEQGGKNDWHYVSITKVDNATLRWTNRGGAQWTLSVTPQDELAVGADCPYYNDGYTRATLTFDAERRVTQIAGPGDEPYQHEVTRIGRLVGNYENHLYDQGGKNDWHYVSLTKIDDNTLQWSNRAGVQWSLTLTDDDNELAVGEDCPYYGNGHTKVTVTFDSDRNVRSISGPFDEPYMRSRVGDVTAALIPELVHRMRTSGWGGPDVPGMLADATRVHGEYMAIPDVVREEFESRMSEERLELVQRVLVKAKAFENDYSSSGDPEMMYHAGSLYHQIDDLENAKRCFEEAVRVAPSFPHAMNDLGYVRTQIAARNRQVDDEARAMIDAARERDPGISTLNSVVADKHGSTVSSADQAPLEHGVSLMMLDQHDIAAALFEDVLTQNPQHAQAHNNMSVCHATSGRVGEALESAIKALELDPKLPFNNVISAAVVVKYGLDYAAARG